MEKSPVGALAAPLLPGVRAVTPVPAPTFSHGKESACPR